MYLLTIIRVPYYTGLHLCNSKVYMDLDNAMARVDYSNPNKRKLWTMRIYQGGHKIWYYEGDKTNPCGDAFYYSIEEVSEEDLKPCDVLRQMKMDI